MSRAGSLSIITPLPEPLARPRLRRIAPRVRRNGSATFHQGVALYQHLEARPLKRVREEAVGTDAQVGENEGRGRVRYGVGEREPISDGRGERGFHDVRAPAVINKQIAHALAVGLGVKSAGAPAVRPGAEAAQSRQPAAERRVAVVKRDAPTTTAANLGIEDRRVKLGCVMPGESVAIFGDALRRLSAAATYLYPEGGRYWYSTQPTVTKLAEDRAEQLNRDPDKVAKELDERLRTRLADPGLSEIVVAEAPATSFQLTGSLELELLSNMTFDNFDWKVLHLTAEQQESIKRAYSAARAFAVVITGDTARFANLILRKGVTPC